MAEPDDNDLGLPDEAYDTDLEPKSSKPWLAMIADATKTFSAYQAKAENVEKQFASLERLATLGREREMQLFWANIQVLAPSIYARPPVPVVVPRFRNRQALQRTASEMLERAVTVAFEVADIDGVMLLIRDDLTVIARGCVWVRYETKAESETVHERVCIEHVHRGDFLHEAARNWTEVGWVAKRSFMTKRAMRKRFRRTSGDAYKDAAFEKRKDEAGNDDGTLKAPVWELWHKGENRVVWVSEGCDKLLDDDKPHLNLSGFFPCPRPAYGTLQRGSLIPVPDFLFIKDQLEEINELTARISALSEAVKLRAFYPAGAGEIADALETAIRSHSNNAVMIPVSNWAMLGSGSVKDMLVWLPVDMIVKAIGELVEMRRQLIDDVYQVTGLSDIMRGSTEASETLGAQQLKSQYGSIRVRDRQQELVRLARDLTRITGEIMAEEFQGKTLLEMSQLETPSNADIARQVKPLQDQIKQVMGQAQQAMADPQMVQQAQANPEAAQQVVQQAQQQLQALNQQVAELEGTPTIEKVVKMLRDENVRPFVLDIETDSTISPDENAQKQRATEYMTALTNYIGTAGPAVIQFPKLAPVFADGLRFVQSQFRVGRDMDQTVDEFVESMKQMASQPPAPDPAQAKAQADAKAKDAELQLRSKEIDIKHADAQSKLVAAQADAETRRQDTQTSVATALNDTQMKAQEVSQKQAYAAAAEARAQEAHAASMQRSQLEQVKIAAEIDRTRAQAEQAARAPKPQAD